MVWPQTGAAAFTVAIAPLINWLLVFKLRLGLDGAASATVLLYTLETVLLVAVVVVRDRRLAGTEQQTWHGWCARPSPCGRRPGSASRWGAVCTALQWLLATRLLLKLRSSDITSHLLTSLPVAGRSLQSLKGWPGYLALAFPSAAMICTEWLTFEVGAPLPTRLGLLRRGMDLAAQLPS